MAFTSHNVHLRPLATDNRVKPHHFAQKQKKKVESKPEQKDNAVFEDGTRSIIDTDKSGKATELLTIVAELDPHYLQTKADKDDGGGMEMGSPQSNDDSNGGDGSEFF
eukprot:scaffold3737_cov72-Cyclotella_meneghiniana.AAC.4